ncbi:DNA repair helicase [Violaceomyces palustris]|uniref:DNA repair helicase n=1 Tax=Violaceomyces palustris TaxID=1673888 RepID=A0ACD0NWQ1_9BASI|nr:DNA repair helicase [Violaceomyces palustris]
MPDQDQRRRVIESKIFGFPYPMAYEIQLDMMKNLFRNFEDGKIGIFESPTGTGKSLSLICSSLTWLRQNSKRSRLATSEVSHGQNGASEEPDWVVKHEMERKRKELESKEEELRSRLKRVRQIREEQRWRRRRKEEEEQGLSTSYLDSLGQDRSRKRFKMTSALMKSGGDEEDVGLDSDEEFLAPDYQDHHDSSTSKGGKGSTAIPNYSKSSIRRKGLGDPPSDGLSPEVRALMDHFDRERKSRWAAEDQDEDPETTPKIIYSSRTHSQLSQFVSELRKTKFGRNVAEEEEEDSVRTIALGSRKQMCINERVQRVGATRGVEAMNELCLELAKGSATASSCEFLPRQDEQGRERMMEFRDRALAEVTDIEDLVGIGREMGCCPYFGSRNSVRQAELVTLPYNLLLQPSSLESLNLDIKGSIIIIDEAHNLIDTILSVQSVSIDSDMIRQAELQIDIYLERFSTRLRGINESNLRLLSAVLKGLARFCDSWAKGRKEGEEDIMTASKMVAEMGGNLDQVNLIKLERWLKETQIARKVSGYSDKYRQRQAEKAKQARGGEDRDSGGGAAKKVNGEETDGVNGPSRNAITAMHSIESFLLSLANRTEDGRILLARSAKEGSEGLVKLKYQLLNPSNCFENLVKEARSIVLAGGTMEPITDFQYQLLPNLPKDRLKTFSCGHIIPSENLLALTLNLSPKNVRFDFRFQNLKGRGKEKEEELLDELGNCVVNFCNVVPDGLVVFLPSYRFLQDVVDRWKVDGVLDRIRARKELFLEPKSTTEVEPVLREYSLAIDSSSQDRSGNEKSIGGGSANSRRNGAILLAVVGAKLSEGINFSDRLARAVVMVGMPFANLESPDLRERMRYVKEIGEKRSKMMVEGQSGTRATTKAKEVEEAASDFYLNLCMKSVNQCIGRAIRHKDDYACLILLDSRYQVVSFSLPPSLPLSSPISQLRGPIIIETPPRSNHPIPSLEPLLADQHSSSTPFLNGNPHPSFPSSLPLSLSLSPFTCPRIHLLPTAPSARFLPQPESDRIHAISRQPFYPSFSTTSSSLARTEIKPYLLADVGEGITECEIIKWFVQPGATVQEFDPICEVQSDKASVEITSRYAGKVNKLNHKVGDVAKVGEALCEIEVQIIGEEAAVEVEDAITREEDVAEEPVKKEESSKQAVEVETKTGSRRHHMNGEEILAIPAVRRISKEHGIDLAQVEGSGKGGRITKEDVIRFIEGRGSGPGPRSSTSTASSTPMASGHGEEGLRETIELEPTRRAMFRAMTLTLQVPHFGYSDEIDVTELEGIRKQLSRNVPREYKAVAEGGEGEEAKFSKLTMLPLLVKAMSLALKDHPLFLSTLQLAKEVQDTKDVQAQSNGAKLIRRSSHDISIALSSPKGLVTPCIESVEKQSIFDITSKIVRLQNLASAKKLSPADLRATGTLTLSNIGSVGGGTYTHPVLPPTGQLAIGAMGRARHLPRYVAKGRQAGGGEEAEEVLEKRLILPVSFTADHRVVEGAELAKLVNRWKELIENPTSWFGLMK